MPTTHTRRPGGRSSRILSAIHAAVGELIGEGAERITFPIIAERAGVSPTTLYRRWGDVNELLEEVTVAALTHPDEDIPDTGTLQCDLTAWADAIVDDITRPERTRFLRAMVSARVDLVSRCLVTEARAEQAEEVVHRTLERRETAPSAQQILDHLIAPLYYRVVFALPLGHDDAHRLARDTAAMAR